MKDLKLIALAVCGMILALLLANLWMTQGSRQVEAMLKPEVLGQVPALPADYEPRMDPETGLAVYDPNDPRWKWWNEMREKDPFFEWKMPINFYGRVVDQDGNPIEGARIEMSWSDLSPRGTSKENVSSDANGEFSLLNETGKALSVRTSKKGYHGGKKSYQSFDIAAFFSPAYYEPDPDNPVDFVLVEKIKAEPLIAYTSSQQLPYDQGPYYYDLRTGLVTEQANDVVGLKVTLYRQYQERADPFEWSVTIEGVNGKIQPTEIEFPQVAPEKGYQSSWEMVSIPADTLRQSHRLRFFFQSDDDHYARVDLYIIHANWYKGGMGFRITSYWNPQKGSRIVEVDKELQKPRRVRSDLK